MPGSATQFPSGRAGLAGRRGGLRMLVADVSSSGVAKGTTSSSWDESGPMMGNVENGLRSTGAHFSSVRNQVRQRWMLTGVTRDSAGAILASCTVTLFTTVDNMPRAITVSDAVGAYDFSVDGNAQPRFAVSYKAGAPDVTGATLNTMVPVLV